MTIERRITFIVGEDGAAVWKLNRLKTLASYFRAVVIFKNVSNSRTSNAEKILSVISLGCQPHHLCQLWIEGSDAELACMVLTDLVAELFDIVNPVRQQKEGRCASEMINHPAMLLPFPLSYRSLRLPADPTRNKSALISRLSQMLDVDKAELVCQSLFRREAISSTYIGHGIALPHVMVAGVKQPALAVVQLDSAVDWHIRGGNVHTVIALLLRTHRPGQLSNPVRIYRENYWTSVSVSW
ncbi:PTS sugar transporter subunit IIA [Vibrio sp. PP-XX7]